MSANNSNGGKSNRNNLPWALNENHPEYKRMYSINGALEKLRDLYAKAYNMNDDDEIQTLRKTIENRQKKSENFLKEFEKNQAIRNFVQQKRINAMSMPPKTRKNRKSKKSRKQRKNRKTRRN